ncbi:hypothetical protein FXO38_18383 [Capsicum annuum]|nr:hypothetical protein FXO38_18383 [Capsicum annuum]KAF3684437.1 hypothetical protein FXO37_01335 [Capsicum annuum]
MVEANQEIENSSILEVGSSSKSDDSSSKGFEFVPLIDSSVVTMNLVDPLGDSNKSMKGMVESNHKTKTSSILEVASTLRSDNNISTFIDAYFDVLNGCTSSTNTISCSHSFTIPPFFGSTSSVSASPPFLSSLEAKDEIVDEIATTRRFFV